MIDRTRDTTTRGAKVEITLTPEGVTGGATDAGIEREQLTEQMEKAQELEFHQRENCPIY